MVSSEIFITYMVSTTLAIIGLAIMCIKNIKRDIELLELLEIEHRCNMAGFIAMKDKIEEIIKNGK